MDSPATILTALTTLIAYAAMMAAIFKLFQIASELGEIKELLRNGARRGSSPRLELEEEGSGTLAVSPLGMDSESYAESLLRKVKEQENAERGKRFEDAPARYNRAPLDAVPRPLAARRLEEEGETIGVAPGEVAPGGDVAQGGDVAPGRARELSGGMGAAPSMPAAHPTSIATGNLTAGDPSSPDLVNQAAREFTGAAAESTGEPSVGRWTREMRRERRVSVRTAPAAGLASQQLSALNSSLQHSAQDAAADPGTSSGSIAPVTVPVTKTSVAESLVEVGAMAQSAQKYSRMDQELPLHTPSPMKEHVAPLTEARVVDLVGAANPSAPAPASSVPARSSAAPLIPIITVPAAAPVQASAGAPVAGPPKLWPPEMASSDGLPSFQPQTTIDWNTPVD